MKRDNKGYTLVELIISVAILSIVMLGIITIMSTSLKTYSSSNLDIAVQEDAQIVANQLEELFSDASSVTPHSTSNFTLTTVENKRNVDGYNQISVNYADTSDFTRTYDLYLVPNPKDSSIYSLVIKTGSKEYTLADNVSSFEITGYNDGDANYDGVVDNEGDVDNKATLKLCLKNKETDYTLVRDIHFRNNIENDDFHSIDKKISYSGGGGGGSTEDINLNVKRYQKYNLTADYGIVEVTSYDTNAFNISDVWYEGNTDATKKYCKVLTTSNTLSKAKLGSSYTIEGKDSTGAAVKIKITVDTVGLSDKTVVSVHDYEGGSHTVNGQGFTSPITVKGINVFEAVKAGADVKFKIDITDGSSSNNSKYKTMVKPQKGGVEGIVEYNNFLLNEYDNKSFDIGVGAAPDAYNGGIYILFPNEGMKTDFDNGDLKLTLTVQFPGMESMSTTVKLDEMGTGGVSQF